MHALSRRVLAGKSGAPALPASPAADQQPAGIEAALALSYAQRPARSARSELMAVAKADLARATDFVRAKGLVQMPAAPVTIITMPKFQQVSCLLATPCERVSVVSEDQASRAAQRWDAAR